MLDRGFIGHEFPTFTTDVEKGRLEFYARAIGETNAIYIDDEAAIAAGYRSLPAPPTFPVVLLVERPQVLPVMDLLGLDIGRVLHGAHEFEYGIPICAGDSITVTERIANIFDKNDGKLEFIELEQSFSNQDSDLVARALMTIIYRNG